MKRINHAIVVKFTGHDLASAKLACKRASKMFPGTKRNWINHNAKANVTLIRLFAQSSKTAKKIAKSFAGVDNVTCAIS